MTDETMKFIQGLRDVAQFYEDHPDVKLPYGTDHTWLIFHATKEEVAFGARAFGKAEKAFEDDRFTLTKTFPSGAKLQFYCNRETVCEKVVIDKRVEPAHVIPAKFEPEVFIAEREVEVVEWRCGSLLAPEPEEANAA